MSNIGRPTAKIICDSISPDGNRLTTMEVKFHRFCLAELNTHCVFERNSASSRAIPVKKQLKMIQEDPAWPLYWGANKPGMQAAGELEEPDKYVVQQDWKELSSITVDYVKDMSNHNLHKQLSNRPLEWFMWHKVIISATDWHNFFWQRLAIDPNTDRPYAQPEMYYAAKEMLLAYMASTPKFIDYEEWHLPYINEEDWEWVYRDEISCHTPINSLKLISSGRCARVSYLTHDGIRDPQEDINLANKMINANPMHPSPFGHVATPARPDDIRLGKFRGWHQMRHEFPNNTATESTVNLEDLVKTLQE